jgi:hypothetical protein
MNLSKGIVVHTSKEAKERWEKCGGRARNKKTGCPSCDLGKIANDSKGQEEKKQ